jgi:alkanesulfonate monooxygenase SsuD/methylene tetrahydromethanopterin reductase-like flavin-dependent oxidoreductase (luciferase family)
MMSIMNDITIGWKASQQHAPIGAYRDLWTRLDESQFDSCWVFDHFIPMGADRSGDIFEAWTILAAMAQLTSRIRLGTLVTGNGYRHPGMLAKMAATVDHVSGGRLDVGLGAGGDPAADAMLGLPATPARERVQKLDEAATVLRLLWSEPVSDFTGSHYQLHGALSDPKPVQQPMPLWLASNGERYGLRVVAQRADTWLTATFDTEPGDLLRLSDVLDQHCTEIGRDPAGLRRAIQFPLPGSDDETLYAAEKFIHAGFRDIILMPRGGNSDRLDATSTLLPRIRELG